MAVLPCALSRTRFVLLDVSGRKSVTIYNDEEGGAKRVFKALLKRRTN